MTLQEPPVPAGQNLSEIKRALLEQRRRGRSAGGPRATAIPRRGLAGPAPLSPAQERLWFLYQLDPGSPVYNIGRAVVLSGPLREEALRAALAAVCRRHEALRTAFPAEAGRPAQRIAPPEPLPLGQVDLEGLPAEARRGEVSRLARFWMQQPFDLASGPVFRAALLRLDGEERVLLVSLHHIVSDAWSMKIFFRELSGFYGEALTGAPAGLPELPVQYADFAAWQRGRLQGETLERLLGYWRQRLAGADGVLELPTDRPRPPFQSFRGASLARRLPPPLTARLRACGRARGATLFATLLAAFQGLLFRFTGQEDLLAGFPVANRGPAEVQGLIGFFVNSLVLRSRAHGDLPFSSLLDEVRVGVLEALEHQELPFERLVEELRPDRSPGRNPLFQVIFDLQEEPDELPPMPGLALRSLPVDSPAAKLDWTLVLKDTPEGLLATLEHSADLFDAETVRRALACFETLLEGIAADPGTLLGDLPLLAPAERREILEGWNRTRTDFPADATIPELFARVAARFPDAPAVASGDAGLSYAELDRRANRLAWRLRRYGVGPETPVAFRLAPSLDVVVAMLGILKAGGTYVPLDRDLPPERLALMLEDSGATVAVTQEDLAGEIGALGATVLLLDAEPEGSEPTPVPDSRLAADHLAYVIYTSGSTGRPKGVAVTHRGVSRLALRTDYVQLAPGDRVAQISNPSFDAATFEIWGPLLNGGTVVICEREVALSPARFAAEMRQRDIDTCFLTTALFNLIVREEPAAFAPLRDVLFGGELCDPRAVRRALERGPRRLLHVYGPTESTTFATWEQVARVPEGAPTVPIGRPLANTRIFVLDRRGQPVPAGIVGELMIAGDGLARGYLGRPGLTAERFVPHPWPEQPGERLYRTGDLVRWLPEGSIEFIGRNDDQVKIRGFRIEPGEVEAALAACPGVAAATVMPRRRPGTGLRLVAWYVPEPQAALSAGELRSRLQKSLPEYMVPAAFVELTALPLNANGKVDRKALPDPVEGRGGEAELVEPEGEIQQALARIWGEVLGIERVGARDNFFALGGHSLLATLVASRIREAFAVDLPLRSLFESPTVEQLADEVAGLRSAGAPAAEAVARPRDVSGPLRPSCLQERTWWLEREVPGTFVNHIQIGFFLEGALDVAVLRASLREIARRHEALRARFPEVEGRPAFVVSPDGELPLPLIDLSGLGERERESEPRRIAESEFRRTFDLGRGPLIRLFLVRLDPQRHLWLRTIHHIIYDGWSEGVFLRELIALYSALLRGETPRLPEPGRYSDYALWQREHTAGAAGEEQLAFWTRELGGASFDLALPTDRPAPAPDDETFQGGDERRLLPQALSGALKELAREEEASLFMVLYAAFQVLLHKITGQTETVLSAPVANRHRREFEEVIGVCVNDMLIRTDLSGDPGFRSLLRQVRREALAGYRHQDLPYEVIERALQPDRNTPIPLYRIQFLHQNMPLPRLELPGIQLRPFPTLGLMAPFELTVEITEREGGVTVRLNYKKSVFDAPTVAGLLERYIRILEEVASGPDRTLSQFTG